VATTGVTPPPDEDVLDGVVASLGVPVPNKDDDDDVADRDISESARSARAKLAHATTARGGGRGQLAQLCGAVGGACVQKSETGKKEKQFGVAEPRSCFCNCLSSLSCL